MENKPVISIIVPVYNTESQSKGVLERCIKSIINQTFKDFELLLIDDGSTDNSSSICDYFAEVDSRIKVYHIQNCGVSSARNMALPNAKGKYITFVDSDDSINEEFLSSISDKRFENIDLIYSGVEIIGTDECVNESIQYKETIVKEMKENDVLFCVKQSTNTLWGKRFSSSIIKKFNICFDVNSSYMEDVEFCMQYISKISSYAMITMIGYFHYEYQSMTLSKRISDYNYVLFLNQAKYYDSFRCYPRVQKQIIDTYYWSVERQIMEISTIEVSLIKKVKCLKRILDLPFLQNHLNESFFNSFVRFLIKYRLYALLILLYKRQRKA